MWLSVLPGRNLAISDHRLPNFLCASMIMRSSSSVHLFFLISGFRWLCHLLECLRWKKLPLSALLSYSTGKCCSYLAPVLRSIFLDHIHQGLVLLVCPRPFYHRRIQNFLPSMKTLDVCSIVEKGSYSFPVFRLNSGWWKEHEHCGNIVFKSTYPILIHQCS